MDEMVTVVNTYSPHIIAITEAWQITPEIAKIDNYSTFYHLRTNKRGGGVVLFCHNSLKPSPALVSVPEGVEALWVRVSPPNHPRHTASIFCCVVYHPPRAPTRDILLTHLAHTSDLLRTQYPSSKIVICGDFNEISTTDLQDEINLSQVVDFATHQHRTLDLILTDLDDHYLPPIPLSPFGRSNHLTIFWSPRPTLAISRERTTRAIRPLTDSAIRNFGQWIVGYPWVEVLTPEDVEVKWQNYIDSLTAAYHYFFPLKSVKTHPADLPWMTARVKRIMQLRDAALRANDFALYRQFRNKVIREIKLAKKIFYPFKLHSLKHTNISQWYNRIKDLCGLKYCNQIFPCISLMSAKEAVSQLNIHFSSICQQLPALDTSQLPAYLPAPSTPPLVPAHAVYQRISNLKLTRSVSPIDIPMKLMLEFAMELSVPLTSIINASLRQSRSPEQWKVGFVTAVPKTPSPATLNELRPVTVTPLPSLLCESFVAEWTYADLAPNIDSRQFGNMKSSSTTHCIVSFLDFIYRALELRKTAVVSTFVDFSKAFDLVDHNIVVRKAASLGLRACLIPWLADFLSGRRQAVRMKGEISNFLPLTCGVPQGTRMGPLCFLAMINDALLETEDRWKYVDDSTFSSTINTVSPDYTNHQYTLEALGMWANNNNVTINSRKTAVMMFDLSSSPVPPPRFSLSSCILDVVQTIKLLGVTIDAKLRWDEHVGATVKASSYRLYMLRRLKSLGVPNTELCGLYKTFILPKLTYASPAWSSSLTVTQTGRLERVQKRATRIILGQDYAGYEDALIVLNLAPLARQYQQLQQKFARNILRNPRHRDLLPPSAPLSRRTLRNANKLQPIQARTERYRRSPIPAMVGAINEH